MEANATLTRVMQEYPKLMEAFERKKKWNEMSETQLWKELCLCILSSNVPYELALSAFWHLRNMQLLNSQWMIECDTATQQIARELSKPIYLPRKKNGSHRKYRFPNIRARNIVNAAEVLYQKDYPLLWILRNYRQDQVVRDFLVRNIPGIGLKQASHFLRNIGYSNSLAIIDSHIISFLIDVGAIHRKKIGSVTPKVYIELETVIQDLSESLDLNLSIFDMAIWRYMRGKSK